MSDAAASPTLPPSEGQDFPQQNGNAGVQHLNGEKSPTPPPHKFANPAQKPLYNPEECKALGNKYFKARDFEKAVEEYTKGE